jgi:hypothetical protein
MYLPGRFSHQGGTRLDTSPRAADGAGRRRRQGAADAATASNLNFSAGETAPNLVMAAASPQFRMSLFNYSPGTAQLIADYYGSFA